MQHGGLREAAAKFVGARDHEIRPALEGGPRELGVEAEVAAPGLVDDEWDAAIMCDLRQGHDIGAGAEARAAASETRARPRESKRS